MEINNVLQDRHKIVLKTLATLKQSLDLIDTPELQKVYSQLRDSVIQRFEYSFDTFWKFLKLYLEKNKQLRFETASPAMIFREAVRLELITPQEFAILLSSIADRNLTCHSYSEETAEKILERVDNYFNVMQAVIERLK